MKGITVKGIAVLGTAALAAALITGGRSQPADKTGEGQSTPKRSMSAFTVALRSRHSGRPLPPG